jgi:hypothetical protein
MAAISNLGNKIIYSPKKTNYATVCRCIFSDFAARSPSEAKSSAPALSIDGAQKMNKPILEGKL